MSTCASVYDFFTQPWVLLLAGLCTILFVILPWAIVTYLLRVKVKDLKTLLGNAASKEKELSSKLASDARGRNKHLKDCTLPALNRLFMDLRTKQGVPADQAKAFLNSLIALAADPNKLAEVRNAVGRNNDEDENDEHYIQFSWETTDSSRILFVDWKALHTPFTLIVPL